MGKKINPGLIVIAVFIAVLALAYLTWINRPLSSEADDYYGANWSLVVELDIGIHMLPFELWIFETADDVWAAQISYSEEQRSDVLPIVKRDDSIQIFFDHYDSDLMLEGDMWQSGMTGRWSKYRGENELAVIDARARPNVSLGRFNEVQELSVDFEGRWLVNFASSESSAIGVFEVNENQIASGTFMTTTGDYRYLAGRVDGNLMRLSTFDGAHAFLFHARMQDDGTIEGDFWSGNWWHETWTAVRDDNAALPDAFEQTVVADEDALDDMVFKNLQGEPTRVLDVLDESNAPARIIEIFGTWCPNCSDAGRELVSLREQYGDDLAVVGLAFEVTEDFDRSVQQVKHHHEHIGTDWPILIAGLSDKEKASQSLPVLDKVRSYPTLIFLDRNNEVKGVYSGFSGPATGDAYTKQRERFEALIESMID